MTDGFRMKRISPRRFRRKFRRELEKMGGPINTPGVTPNLLIDEARQKVAEDPTGASLDAWHREAVEFIDARGHKYPLLALESRRRYDEARDTAREEAGLA